MILYLVLEFHNHCKTGPSTQPLAIFTNRSKLRDFVEDRKKGIYERILQDDSISIGVCTFEENIKGNKPIYYIEYKLGWDLELRISERGEEDTLKWIKNTTV